MKMDGIRQQLFIDYMYYLNETDRFYATKARYAKHVLDFLESAISVDRRGFMAFKREHSLEMANFGRKIFEQSAADDCRQC